ncbi:MAG: hypothetical protein PHD43_12610 [Methylococcales bacterium]|nr:hypothetical protein [Methylococcales bacterium]
MAAAVGGFRQLHQSQDREKHLRLRDDLKANQSHYLWAQNIVAVGLLKQVKGRWACLFLDFRFYLARKTIEADKDNAKIKGTVVPFQTKLEQLSWSFQ